MTKICTLSIYYYFFFFFFLSIIVLIILFVIMLFTLLYNWYLNYKPIHITTREYEYFFNVNFLVLQSYVQIVQRITATGQHVT